MKFKVGDKVVVSGKCEEVGLIGKEGVIEDSISDLCCYEYYVTFKNGTSVFYGYELELIK